MTKIIKNLIAFFILLASCNSAFCYVLSSEELKQDIQKEVQSQIENQLKTISSDIKINVLGVPKTNILTNEINKPKIEIISQNNVFQPNSYRRVMVRNSDGMLVKAFPITVQTQVFADVLTAKEVIAYNDLINSNNSQIERKDISKYLGKTYSKVQENLVAKKNFQKGNLITSNYTKEQSCISKNSDVDIVFQSKGMNIKLRGKALKEGSIGDMILVRSDKYNKTYTGIVKSSGEVVVRI